jgi:crotonobetaine/carnitine-CoA ligase
MYSGHDDPNRWVLIQALAEHSARHPDETWVEMTSGESLTFGQAFDDAERVAAWLASLGIEPGQHVAVMLNNGLDFARIWMGLARLGAVGDRGVEGVQGGLHAGHALVAHVGLGEVAV